MRSLRIMLVVCALGFIACSTTNPTKTKGVRYSRNYISSEEIRKNLASSAYELIRRLRPHWLSGRGSMSIRFPETAYPVVYVNSNRHGDIASLSWITPDHITEIRFLNAGDASNRFGLDHAGGAILIEI